MHNSNQNGKTGIYIGMEHELVITVTPEMTAEAYGSGNAPVYATPCMIANMEIAAALAVCEGLDEGFVTVGTKVDISHIAATPVGLTVRSNAVLKEIDGRRLVFDVTATDDVEVIGKGTHERFIVDKDKFVKKVYGKKTDK